MITEVKGWIFISPWVEALSTVVHNLRPVEVNSKALILIFHGFAHFASGLTVGICGIAAGAAIGILGDSAIRAYAQQPKVYVTMIILLVFAEVLAIYGMIVGIFLAFV
ncbi:hypothetical protein RF11_14358 [Thelohanellus kitauei]|uniref:V-ATPase proteolipid subunit C-like domain-containing protein n=1 Tax=Thelohanellus kitauei TaxID=669202 RepID=A0A0C2NIU9_THEKT|nr:hypothetical protein RF11_14358 [Thelohanellus kitauei]